MTLQHRLKNIGPKTAQWLASIGIQTESIQTWPLCRITMAPVSPTHG